MNSHDEEDAFQAVFLILARRAASIGRREKLAGWLHGVAVRAASEVRRRGTRASRRERRLMEESNVGTNQNEGPDDALPLLDEELNRLPQRFRVAIVACELEGKSRREAAAQLGLSEGTLSTHLARGRKLLRERLLRRGVSVAVGPAAGLVRPNLPGMISERLMDSTVQAALGFAARGGSATGSAAVTSLAERVLKNMILARLCTAISVMVVAGTTPMAVLGLFALLAAGSPTAEVKPGPADLAGRIVDEAGRGVANAHVWAVVGSWGERKSIATGETDDQGRFVLPKAWDQDAAKASITAGQFGVFAQARDGRVGWLAKVDRGSAGPNNTLEIAVGIVGEAHGRVTDQTGRPIAGARVTPLMIDRASDSGAGDSFNLNSEFIASHITTTAEDGTFVLKDTPRGASVRAAIEAPGIGWLHFLWDSSRLETFTFDNRLGQIKGRIKLADGSPIPSQIMVRARLAGASAGAPAHAGRTWYHSTIATGMAGSFHFDNLPPGRYVLEFDINQNVPVEGETVENVDVAPGALTVADIPAKRLWTITGRVVDSVAGEGLAGVAIHCYRLHDKWYVKDARETKTGPDGRYSIAAAPGTVKIFSEGLAQAELVPQYNGPPALELIADHAWPDLKLVNKVGLDGVVADEMGRPAVGAEVYVLDGGPTREEEVVRTEPDGTFHIDRLDPDGTLSVWAHNLIATTNGCVTVRPRNISGKLTLTIDPKFACQIRGMATDIHGTPLRGATVKLWWGRPYTDQEDDAARGAVSILKSYVTTKNGWFVFRGLWPGCQYGAEVLASGQTHPSVFTIDGQSGRIYDVGKIVALKPTVRLAGRVVDSSGRPVSGAAVFYCGDGLETDTTSADLQGRFRFDSLPPETKYVFIRKEGYRFTGVDTGELVKDLGITLLKMSEPAPRWNPAATSNFSEQRAFAKQMLIRLWEKIGANADANQEIDCILAMAEIDLQLASHWSVERDHRHDNRIREFTAEALAETDAQGAIDLLSKGPGSATQAFLERMAWRFGGRDRDKALLFADKALANARKLGDDKRAVALSAVGSVMSALGRKEAGRALIEEATIAAAQLGTEDRAAQDRAIVAAAIAPLNLKKAMDLVEPVGAQEKDRCLAFIARAIAKTDTAQAVALANKMDGPNPVHERVKTAIAYKIGADRPDEAIKIIESINRDNARRWQAEAFGWLAVALEPRDRGRALALIDRALNMITDGSIAAESTTGYEMLAAAHIAACARQIGYPDMESVVMRIIAARPGNWRGDAFTKLRFVSLATIELALLDPGCARTVLKQIEAQCHSVGLNPAGFANDRGRWLIASALADLEKAKTLCEAELAALDESNERELLFRGLLNTAKFLATPPANREAALQASFPGDSWRPGQAATVYNRRQGGPIGE
jgi:RNA polymerase sigma factor (sigma-70 family)